MSKLTHLDMSDAAFPFMDIRRMDLGMAPAIVGRVSYTGDLGYEIWMKPEYQRYLYDLIMEAGAEFGIRLFGLRALNALRLEKSLAAGRANTVRSTGRSRPGLAASSRLKKDADFIGKAAAAKEKAEGGTLAAAHLHHRCQGCRRHRRRADLSLNGKVCGWVTSGGYAHASGVSVAIGYVPKEIADEAEGWSDRAARRNACRRRLQSQPLFDANGVAHALLTVELNWPERASGSAVADEMSSAHKTRSVNLGYCSKPAQTAVFLHFLARMRQFHENLKRICQLPPFWLHFSFESSMESRLSTMLEKSL